MIISRKYKYLFIELPRTASTAISQELRDFYDGEKVLWKHATYLDFLKVATPEERSYFIFSGIRNPLDHAVSIYFKIKNDHRAQFSDTGKLSKRPLVERISAKRKYDFVRNNGADFSAFFKKFYNIPYNDWSSLSHKQFNFIIRYEQLQTDFATVLELLDIDPVRPLPIINKTEGKGRYLDYYNTPELRQRAADIFGPFMQEWGYTFPPEWGDIAPSRKSIAQFKFFNVFRHLYWKHLRIRPHRRTREGGSGKQQAAKVG